MLPDWAPNLHPLIVHFPISLLAAAALTDVAGLFWRTSRGLRLSAVLLYGAGAVGALASYLTGNRAADTVDVPTEAVATLNTHQDLALYTLIFFGGYAVARVVLYLVQRELGVAVRIFVVLVGIGGQYLVWQTGEHGGRLVFEHGVGVSAVDSLSREVQNVTSRQHTARAAPSETEGGGFEWIIGPGADDALGEAFAVVEGSLDDVRATVQDEEDGHVLALEVGQDTVMFVAGDSLASVDTEAEIDVTDFTGSVSLVHNVQEPDSYHYLRLGEEAVLGRVTDGTDEPMGSRSVEPGSWTTLRATGDQGHFYGYVNDETIAHGHSAAPPPGPAGLRIEGSGTVRLRRLTVRSVE